MPGCSIRPFCDAPIATLTPSASIANGAAPSEATTSTTNSAGWPAASIARRSAARSLVVPLAVSVWTAKTARDAVAGVVAQHGLDRGRIDRQPVDVRRAHRDAAERLDLLGPAVGEVAGARHQDRRARRDQVRDHRLPAAVAVRRVEEDLGARRSSAASFMPDSQAATSAATRGSARSVGWRAIAATTSSGTWVGPGECSDRRPGMRVCMAGDVKPVGCDGYNVEWPPHLHWRPSSIGRSAMDPKKPPVPRRVWRMTTDSPQGEFVDVAQRPDRNGRAEGRQANLSSGSPHDGGPDRPAGARQRGRPAKRRCGC